VLVDFDGAVDVSATFVDPVDDLRDVEVNDSGGAQVHGAVNPILIATQRQL
jgi:hypothetical protein